MTKLLTRIEQIESLLGSLMDECTECDPRKLAIARTEFEKSFVWLKYVTKDYVELGSSVTVTIPFTATDEVIRNADNTINISSGVGTLAVYRGAVYLGQGRNRAGAIKDLNAALLRVHPDLKFNLQEVMPTILEAVSSGNKWSVSYEGKVYLAGNQEELEGVLKELGEAYPQCIFQINKTLPQGPTVRLEYVPGEVGIHDPYGKRGHVVYGGKWYCGCTADEIITQLNGEYPDTRFNITGINRLKA